MRYIKTNKVNKKSQIKLEDYSLSSVHFIDAISDVVQVVSVSTTYSSGAKQDTVHSLHRNLSPQFSE